MLGDTMYSKPVTESWVGRDERHPVRVPAIAMRPDASSFAVTVSNISYQGCQIEADAMLMIGETITIALPRMGEIKAQIRWSSVDGKAGALFLAEEIRPDEPHSRIGL